jgi:DNA-binding MarR family transcriptional regulator
MTDLSRIMSIERSSLTSMVDRLERRSLLARNAHPTDRRASQIALTPDGHTLADQAHTAFTDRVEALTTGLSAKTRETLTAAVTHITAPN